MGALDELAAKARAGHCTDCEPGGRTSCQYCICHMAQRKADIAYTAVAVNNIKAALEALEKQPCESLDVRGMACFTFTAVGPSPPKCDRCAVLAAIEREAKEALA